MVYLYCMNLDCNMANPREAGIIFSISFFFLIFFNILEESKVFVTQRNRLDVHCQRTRKKEKIQKDC